MQVSENTIRRLSKIRFAVRPHVSIHVMPAMALNSNINNDELLEGAIPFQHIVSSVPKVLMEKVIHAKEPGSKATTKYWRTFVHSPLTRNHVRDEYKPENIVSEKNPLVLNKFPDEWGHYTAHVWHSPEGASLLRKHLAEEAANTLQQHAMEGNLAAAHVYDTLQTNGQLHLLPHLLGRVFLGAEHGQHRNSENPSEQGMPIENINPRLDVVTRANADPNHSSTTMAILKGAGLHPSVTHALHHYITQHDE